ncbi:MAG: helix-turn-helix domain-containing protein [Butyrivibrio sp.]|nr:helix-turn-helix domain-containing protein [Muribaculum sp.]MCM1551133.1 helix-turn-helix domain-containing protein [Butyrivibrio sp.]
MDNQKFGQFILSLRKERGWTQLELAEKLNVTDKAISKWERGVGFPDIKMIEPLAETFGVSVLEIMCSEKMDVQPIHMDNAAEAINNVINIVDYQRKIEKRNIIITIISFSLIVMSVFLIDNMQWEGVIMVCLPIIMLGTGIYLIGLSVYRARQRLTYATTLSLGILALLFPILVFLLLCFGFLLGGPVPS